MCAPLLDRTCPQGPEKGWGPFTYQYVCGLMYPGGGFAPEAGRCGAGAQFYLIVLQLLLDREREALSRLEAEGAAAVLSRLGPGSGFRVLPYRAVGVRSGLLLCFRADWAQADGRELGEITVALSPGAVSEGGAAALWGGETGKEGGGHAA